MAQSALEPESVWEKGSCVSLHLTQHPWASFSVHHSVLLTAEIQLQLVYESAAQGGAELPCLPLPIETSRICFLTPPQPSPCCHLRTKTAQTCSSAPSQPSPCCQPWPTAQDFLNPVATSWIPELGSTLPPTPSFWNFKPQNANEGEVQASPNCPSSSQPWLQS